MFSVCLTYMLGPTRCLGSNDFTETHHTWQKVNFSAISFPPSHLSPFASLRPLCPGLGDSSPMMCKLLTRALKENSLHFLGLNYISLMQIAATNTRAFPIWELCYPTMPAM